MNPSHRRRPWHHNTRQYTLLEYASLKQACPDGIYISLKPGSPLQWPGVFFVRKGPYAPAILRFQITFPPDYPDLPPTLSFVTDIFHPLVTPLTTYTYTTGSASSDTVSATDEERLPPGGFSLRHGFPHWFGRAQRSAASSATSTRNVSASYETPGATSEGPAVDSQASETSSGGIFAGASSPSSNPPRMDKTIDKLNQPEKLTSIVEVLDYMKRSFDDETALDTLPQEAAGNSGAWKAWRAYRAHQGGLETENESTDRDEWDWDGVWEQRVRKGIDSSISESALYGGTGGLDGSMRFVDIENELVTDIRAKVAGTRMTVEHSS